MIVYDVGTMNIAIGSDHAGVALKDLIVGLLPEGAEVNQGASETLDELGVTDVIGGQVNAMFADLPVLMPQIIGYSRAFEWGVTGRTLDADEAHRIGFVNEIVDPDDLLPRCEQIAHEIIENCPPMTVQLFKLALTASLDQSLEQSVAFTAQAQRIARQSDDHTEALRAYAEKRRPVWKGR